MYLTIPAARRLASLLVMTALASCGSSPPAANGTTPERGILQIDRGPGGPPAPPPADTRGGDVIWTVPPTEHVITPPKVIQAPDSVVAGEPFDVIVTTLGPNGCWSAGSMSVVQESASATLTPEDRHSGAAACTEVFGYLPHRVTLTFHVPGTATLRVDGRLIRSPDGTIAEPISASKRVVVVARAS